MAFPSLRHLWASALLSLPSSLSAQSFATPSPWGDWVEKDFPHFSSVLDARDLPGFPKDNLTPRGLILNLGNNLWACFDTDLLRIAAIWEAEAGKPPVTPEALAPGSYHLAGQKTKDGQEGVVYMPTVYPWTAKDMPNPLRLGRGTEWQDDSGLVRGLGMREFLIGEEAKTLAELTEITFD